MWRASNSKKLNEVKLKIDHVSTKVEKIENLANDYSRLNE